MSVEIPLPIQFNPYKHHFRFLLSEIGSWQPDHPNEWQTKMLLIGNNLFDFYLGDLMPVQIANLCIEYFNQKNLLDSLAFYNWLDHRDWKKISLSDKSEWLIKRGNLAERFIHIHPAKFSKHTIRVRAATLKTVIVLCIYKIPLSNDSIKNLRAVNRLRKSFLGLSPVKSINDPDSGILKLWQLFVDAITEKAAND
ncbi:hypothetical protein [uncultured Draconibacterium sp.]|uniref:hypothetical protein n=1 Tax=uncultured Draconibacterium sp. TaxID=1573823 RepID=UPI002AA7FDCB|nr:hypothetical protein [uncultured Draconibacterium sp.]